MTRGVIVALASSVIVGGCVSRLVVSTPAKQIRPRKPRVQNADWTQRRYREIDNDLNSAVEKLDISAVNAALKAGANPNSKQFWHGILKCDSKNEKVSIQIGELLLASGANINGQSFEYDYTPLSLQATSYKGGIEYAKFLLDHGADPNKPGWNGLTPLHEAVREGNEPMVRLLLDRGAKLTVGATWPPAIFSLPYVEENWITQDNIYQERDPRVRWYFDRPPHFELAYHWDASIADLLIQHGADLNARDGFGMTVLHLAAARSEPATIQGLITRGARVNSQTKAKNTPLHFAIKKIAPFSLLEDKDFEVISTLLKSGVDRTLKNSAGQTAEDVLIHNANEVLYWEKANPGLDKNFDYRNLREHAERAIRILNPEFKHLAEPKLKSGPDGTIYGTLLLGRISPKWPEYDYPHPGFTTGPPRYPDEVLVKCERAVSVKKGIPTLTLVFRGTQQKSVNVHLNALQLNYCETESKLPLEFKLAKGERRLFRFAFPPMAAVGPGSIHIEDVVDNLSDASELEWSEAHDVIDESAPLDEIFKFDCTEKDVTDKPAYLLNEIPGRTVIVEFKSFTFSGKTMSEFIGKQFICKPGQKVILKGTKSNGSFGVSLRARILPNKQWISQGFSAS